MTTRAFSIAVRRAVAERANGFCAAPLAKLTEAAVTDMRSRFTSAAAAAREFGVSKQTAWRVLNRLTWRHV